MCKAFARAARTPRCRDEDSGVIEHSICTRTEKTLAKVASFEKYRSASISDVKRWENIFSRAARSRAYIECLGKPVSVTLEEARCDIYIIFETFCQRQCIFYRMCFVLSRIKNSSFQKLFFNVIGLFRLLFF